MNEMYPQESESKKKKKKNGETSVIDVMKASSKGDLAQQLGEGEQLEKQNLSQLLFLEPQKINGY